MRIFKRALKVIAWTMGIGAGLLIITVLILELLIWRGVESYAEKAMAQFQGDRVEALIAVVDCRNCRIEDRNHAVWALGQLRDKRSLPVLYKYRTGNPCSHSTSICQYEITKAVRWTEGNSYMAPELWRILLTKDRPQSARVHS